MNECVVEEDDERELKREEEIALFIIVVQGWPHIFGTLLLHVGFINIVR